VSAANRGALLALAAFACDREPPAPSIAPPDAAIATSTSSVELETESPIGRVLLPEGKTLLGVSRARSTIVRTGPSAEEPTIAVMEDGAVLVAFSFRRDAKEHLALRRASSAGARFSPGLPLTEGERAWHPRLAIGADGAAWVAWCGREGSAERGDHRKDVQLRYVAPGPPADPILVSPKRSSPRDRSRHCDPEIAASPDGIVHVVWEASDEASPLMSRIAYRRYSPGGEPLGPIEMVSRGPFDRRPSIVATSTAVYVAWDSLVDERPSGAIDPDYDVFLRTRTSTAWGTTLAIDRREGIQAAPALALAEEGLLIAYHSSARHGLVKWWELRRVRGKEIEMLAASDPAAAILPQGEQQGAELPAIAVDSTGRVVLGTRSSHGSYLFVIDARGISQAIDLTTRGWGARGLRMDLAFAPDGSLLMARRSRHHIVFERFTFREGGGSPAFVSIAPESKPKRVRSDATPLAIHSRISDAFANAIIHFGDVHMHSAVSDGTGPPDEIYARARVRGLQFATLTDHDYVAGSRMMLSEHDEITWLTDRFDAAPGFTAIHAFEWTTMPVPIGAGHKNVYFRSHPPSPLKESKNGYGTTALLQRSLAEENAFTAPHHTGWSGTDWDEADPNIQRHFEIVSVHGTFEDIDHQPLPTRAAKRGMFAVDGLKRGKRFGFVGGSDAHGLLWHHGVGRRMDPWTHGLTGAIATDNERGAIWDALYARRTFATSGARMWILTAIAGAPQGAELSLRGKPTIEWEVQGTLPLEKVVIVRDGAPIKEIDAGAIRHKGSHRDDGATPGWHSYYVRAHQGAGIPGTDAVWSSPIFVQVTE
jgi:hypothetical protein